MKRSPATDALPPLYARWMDDLLTSPIAHETRATCDDCVMCAPEGEGAGNESFYFSPAVKCCSYQPRLPNYLVGRALEDDDFAFSAGRKTLENRIDAGLGVTPLGLQQTAVFDVLYKNGKDAFGRSSALRCPHYLEEAGGRCGVWRHRNSICATWFCKHDRGGLGMTFWHRLRDLLMAIESSLAAWCVLESYLEPEALEFLFPKAHSPGTHGPLNAAEMDGRPEPDVARRLWGRWLGRERDFYRRCAQSVSPLKWRDVERIGGSQVAVAARLTRRAFEALAAEDLPERLVPGSFHIVSAGADGVRVIGYSGTDPLDLDPAILQVLPYFDGRPTKQALQAIERELHLRVEEDLVQKLADFEILAASPRDES